MSKHDELHLVIDHSFCGKLQQSKWSAFVKNCSKVNHAVRKLKKYTITCSHCPEIGQCEQVIVYFINFMFFSKKKQLNNLYNHLLTFAVEHALYDPE